VQELREPEHPAGHLPGRFAVLGVRLRVAGARGRCGVTASAGRWPSRWQRPGRGTPETSPEVALLAALLRDRPSLPGALCRGQAPRFDADQLDGETEDRHAVRLTAARSVCQRCPERLACPAPLVRVPPRQVTRTS